MKQLLASVALVSALGLSACGSTHTERGLSGGAIGAGVGAGAAAIIGSPILGGALIGAGVGAAAGVLTDQDDIDLGSLVD